MATKLQKTIKVSKRKLRSARDKAVKWAKRPKNKKILLISAAVVVAYVVWKKYGKTVPAGPTVKNPHDSIPNPPPTSNPNPGTPGTVTPYPPSNGVMAPKLAEFGYPGHLNIVWAGSDGNWSATDTAFVVVPDGYHIANFFDHGGRVVIGTLNGFEWDSNNPIFIEKGIVKDGVDDLYWYGLNADDPLRRANDGASMSNNTSFAYQGFYFNKF